MQKIANSFLLLLINILDKCMLQIIKDIEDNKLNQLELKFYKQILGVRRNASTIGVRGEIGRHPIGILAVCNSIKYLHSIQAKSDDTLVKKALDASIELSGKCKNTWFNAVTRVEETYKPKNTIRNSNKREIKRYYKAIVQSMKTEYEAHWWKQLNAVNSNTKNRGGNKLRTYNQLKQNFSLEPYLLHIDNISQRKL